ncbi:MAG: ABC transporter permease [Thermoleophilia bacterium]|nr:ABC transporter permease [Thermoleophilia bacterium]
MSSSEAVSREARRVRTSLLAFDRARDYGILVALVILFVVLSFSSEFFFTKTNLLNVLQQWAPVGVMALGGTFVLITGGFDLSIGAIFALSGVVSVLAVNASTPLLGAAAGLTTGLALGTVNGLLGTVARMNVFVATIGTMIVFAGTAAVITGGRIQIADDEGYGFVRTRFLDVNVAIWIFAAVMIASSVLLNRTVFGRYVFAIGGNEEAARLAGVRVYPVRIAAFALSGLAGGLAAVMVASRSLSANATGNSGIAFGVWTALLLGGNSLLGGEGAIWRTMVGVFLLALIANGFDLLGLTPLYQQVATGSILLAAVGLDAWARAKRR